MQAKVPVIIICLLCLIGIYFPNRHAIHYSYIEDENILQELQVQSSFLELNLKTCRYQNLIHENYESNVNDIYVEKTFVKPDRGGEFKPPDCHPLYHTAIIVPYRDRSSQFKIFLNYMHTFLQNQRISYRIFIIEQNNTLPFNRAKLINYGAKVAMSMNFTCLILHDVDLIPINSGNIYACSKSPRHMSSSIDVFRYNLPYNSLFGGAVAILSEHLVKINGLSNIFYGWGGEDDDFYKRLLVHNLFPYRFSPRISKYIMLFHKKEKASHDRWAHLSNSLERMENDGLSSLANNYVIEYNDYYTHVFVDSNL